jgi:hypothetical protein
MWVDTIPSAGDPGEAKRLRNGKFTSFLASGAGMLFFSYNECQTPSSPTFELFIYLSIYLPIYLYISCVCVCVCVSVCVCMWCWGLHPGGSAYDRQALNHLRCAPRPFICILFLL